MTLVGSLSPAIAASLRLTDAQIGWTGTAYVLGAVAGALVFGRLADRFGRRRLFSITVCVYLVGTLATGISWSFASLAAFRFLTGAGIGGEYGAVNSAIDELIPARVRGRIDLGVAGTFWLGAALGAVASVAALDPALGLKSAGWRIAFVIGGLLALVILWLRRYVPESPRWLLIHGRPKEAQAIVAAAETVAWQGGRPPAHLPAPATIRLEARGSAPWSEIIRVLFRRYPKRTLLVFVLMAAQAFCYNAVFFTYALILARFFHVGAGAVGWYILPFAAGNFAGPLILGPLFDSLGRRVMTALTYGLAGGLLALTGWLFALGVLGPASLTLLWSILFFFASAGASAAYLAAGECFPLEMRSISISLFYAAGSILGAIGPALFGALVGTGERGGVLAGCLLAGGLMALAAVVALLFGVAAERAPLEAVAPPLSLVHAPSLAGDGGASRD